MRRVIRWFRTPLPLEFWLLAAAAPLPLFLGIDWLALGVEYWGDSPRAAMAVVAGSFMLVLGAFFVRRAVRAYPRESRPTQLP